MISFTRQFWNGVLWLILLVGITAAAAWYWRAQLHYSIYLSGWFLFALMMVLTLFNGRKKLPFLPIGTVRGWLHFHMIIGWFAAFLFIYHIHWRRPTGWFEGVLASLFLLVTFSGVVGAMLSRSISRRLTTRGGEVIYEKIPGVRRSLEEKAESLALGSIASARTSTIADFYVRHVQGFLRGPQNFWLHIMEVRRPLNFLLDELKDVERYLDANEKLILAQLQAIVLQKDDLDYHHALQTILKAWLFIHIPFTYSLLIFSICHIVLVYAFWGGAR